VSFRLRGIARRGNPPEDGHAALCGSGCVDAGDVDLCGRRSRKVVREGKVGSEPETMATWLSATGLKAVGAKDPPARSFDVPLHCNGTEKVGD